MFRVRCFNGFHELPMAHRALVTAAETNDFFRSPAWFAHLMAHFYQTGHQIRVYALERVENGEPMLLMPLRACQLDYSAFGARTLGSISHPENYATVAFMFAEQCDDEETLLIHLLRSFRAGEDGLAELPVDMLRLWPVQTDAEQGKMLRRALRHAGFVTQIYSNSYNRYENTAGMSYEAYLTSRSANLRYSIRRRQRALEKSGALEFALHRDSAGLEAAIADYVSVSLASWKDAESMVSEDMLGLIRLTATKGCLRFGILRVDGIPVAAQFWIVTGGVAHCARLGYHEDYKHLSVGVVLTNFMIAHVLDNDHVDRIDFGYGEDDYKGGWMKDSREYYGFLAFNRSTRRGLFHGLKNIVGRPLKRGIKATLKALRRRPEAA